MEMQSKRKRKHKRKHKHASGAISDKHTIIKRLQKLNFCLDRILRAIKVYEHNYGKKYDFNTLTEIVVRLKKKDALKYEDPNSIHCKEEEKRNTTKYLIDDIKNNNNTNPRELSLSVSSNVNTTPISLNDYYSFDMHQTQNTNTNQILHEDYQYDNNNNNNNNFEKCMNLFDAESLELFDTIDHRDFVGKFCIAAIVEIDKYNSYNLKIHYDGYTDDKYDCWCDFRNELFRFAKYRSISRRFQNKNEYMNDDTNKVYKCNVSIGDFVFINPIYTIFGGTWFKGIINKFDKKSDQIQVAYQPNINKNNNDYILYWTHIDNIYEIKSLNHYTLNTINTYKLKQKYNYKQVKNKKEVKTVVDENNEINEINEKKDFSVWSTKQVIEWINKIENGKFKDDIFDHFRQQIEIIQLKGYELTTLNETALKFAGLLNKYDRKIIINNVLHLVNENNNTFNTKIPTKINTKINSEINNDLNVNKEMEYEYSLDGNETIDVDLNLKFKKYNKNTDGGANNNIKQKQSKDTRVLDEVMDLWKQ